MEGERHNFVVERRGERGMRHPFEQARKYGEPLSDNDWTPRDVTGTELV